MKFVTAIFLILGIVSALYFFYGNSDEVMYTDKQGLLAGEAGVVTVCTGFPRLKHIYVNAKEESWQRKGLEWFCDSRIAQSVVHSREKDAEEAEFQAEN